MNLEIRHVVAIVHELERQDAENIISEEINVLATITDETKADMIYKSNGFDYKGKLHQITYRGYDIENDVMFVLFGEKRLSEEGLKVVK